MSLRTRKIAPLDAFVLVATVVVVAMVVGAHPARGQESANGATVYKSKCSTCHGADGAGTAVGKSLKVADLRSDEVQKQSDDALIQAVTEGKGNMPGFKGNITDDEIHAAVTFVRTFAKKK